MNEDKNIFSPERRLLKMSAWDETNISSVVVGALHNRTTH